MNPLHPRLFTGTFGELLVQLRLFQYGVQAAPPIKDSGNDLIAVRGTVFKAIQVKTTQNEIIQVNNLPELYHILALVFLDPTGEDNELSLDRCEVYLLDQREINGHTRFNRDRLAPFVISQRRVDELFQ